MDEIACAVEAAWPFQDDTTIVIPYRQNNLKLFREMFLPEMYFRLKEENLLPLIFPGMNVYHLNDFICYMAKVRGFVIPCRKEGDQVQPAGLGWMAEVDGPIGARKGSFGFGFFDDMKHSRDRILQHVSLSFEMLDYWFTTFEIDQMFGSSLNPAAIRYSKHFGFSRPVVLPRFFNHNGSLIDASVISLEREVFKGYYSAWRSPSKARGYRYGRQRSQPAANLDSEPVNV